MNIVFMMNIRSNSKEERFGLEHTASRSLPSQFAIKSWNTWCKKNNAELFILDELLLPMEEMAICWQRYYLFDILDANEIDYDQILMVDADTIVHPDCPNFFNETEHKYCGVMNDGCYEWVNRSIEKYHNFLFADVKLNTWNYFNSGFMVLHKSHKNFCDKVYEFYNSNRDKIVEAQQKFMVGTDQTPINFLTRRHNVELKWLPNSFNLHDPYRKNLLHIDPTNWWPDTLDNLFNSGWVYHFNSIPQNRMSRDASYWMKRTFEELYK